MVTGQAGYDRVRQYVIGKQDFDLEYFEEVYTSEHWMVRIYRVLDEPKVDMKPKNKFKRNRSSLESTRE